MTFLSCNADYRTFPVLAALADSGGLVLTPTALVEVELACSVVSHRP
jgi:hypothetical protein